jgi:CDP-glucose 4,6-dehydratase
MINREFWADKKVFITGHTGFKGSWLCLWLISLGAKVTGYALEPPTTPSLFSLCNIDSKIKSIRGDIKDKEKICQALIDSDPDIVFHMAAQPLVRDAYRFPIETYEINVMGTAYLLDGVRYAIEQGKKIKALVNVTTDKCYENKEWSWGYREIDQLGGYDPYSNSKACSELVTDSYRKSFFHSENYDIHGLGIATARAGNVIGGGDWAADRLIPDCMRALLNGETIRIRSPHSIRPWQHVLEPLSGYLTLAERLYKDGDKYSEAWNFGPNELDVMPVEWIVKEICKKWDITAQYEINKGPHPHEATYLKLDCSKAKMKLGWHPKWNLEHAIEKVMEWTRAYKEKQDLSAVCLKQIKEYENCGE